MKTTAMALWTLFLSAGLARAADVPVTSDIALSQTWTANNVYELQGQIHVLPGATLTIEAGTVVASSFGGSLTVTRGAELFVNGTSCDPVIFTSQADVATWTGGDPKTGIWREAAGEWGGLTVLGLAYVSENGIVTNTPFPSPGNVAAMEGLVPAFPGDPRVLYGGGDDDDDSGALEYVSIRYAGLVLGLGNELNGLSLGAVGRGTDIHHVDVMNCQDDGIEIFGGTVDIEHFSVWNVGDDSLDIDQGWRGKAQFGLIVQGHCLDAAQGSGVGDNAIEIDGAENSDWQPVTTATIYNVTVIGQPVGGDHGTAWRDSARVQFRNCVFMDLGEQLVRFDNVDGNGGSGYGASGTLSWPAVWTTSHAVFSPVNAPPNPADFYEAQTSGSLAEIKDSVFFRNLHPSAYTEANARGVLAPSNDNVLVLGTDPASGPIRQVVRGPAVIKGGNVMLPVVALDPRAANAALTSVGTAPSDGFFTAAQFRGAFGAVENWLSGWTACDAFGFLAHPLPPAPSNLSCQVPAAWQATPVAWARDVNPSNKIDDTIDDDVLSFPTFDVIVCFKDCPTVVDVQVLQALSLGGVQKIGRYISFVSVSGMSYAALQALALDPRVAFIERQFGFSPTTDKSIPALRVTESAEYSPFTVEDAFPTIDGSGVNIAIVDSGVDNLLHECFAGTTVIGGYDAVTQVFGDPVDAQSHGTLVAAIALGKTTSGYPTGYPGIGVSRGMAPGANLIDVKVFDNVINPLTCTNGTATWNDIVDGLETLLSQHQLWMGGDASGWRVDVINMSLRQCDSSSFPTPGCTISSDGLDAFSQMVDLASALGIVVVAAAGNDGDAAGACFLSNGSCHPHLTGPSTPGAASRAITVGASYDNSTVDRADDGINCFTTRGPRLSDGDSDLLDELKPEVCAPGFDISTALFGTVKGNVRVALGTSMAAPHVAGLAALILEARPGITPGAVKDLIISTADPLPLSTPSNTSVDPIWNNRGGWGLVDAFAALDAVTVADLSFPNHPASPPWASVDITTSTIPPQVGVATTVTAMVENLGPSPVAGVHVLFGVHVYSASTPVFHDIGTKIVNLPLGVTPVTIQWTPAEASHQCLKVEIAYGNDTVPSNNTANRNLSVASSPMEFTVANDISPDPLQIGFEVSCPAGDTSGWQVVLDPPLVVLTPQDGSVKVRAFALAPGSAPVGASVSVDVAAVVQSGPLAGERLGGITFLAAKEDCNGNGTDDLLETLIGVLPDCNANWVPDGCELRSGAAQDCNQNGIPDACDIGSVSRDVNQDGIPDECQSTPYVGPLLKQH